MRIIDQLRDVIEYLKPHKEFLFESFEKENKKFKELFATDHDLIGRVLKCHLVLEQYLNKYLEHHFGQQINESDLRFYQKAKLIPDSDPRAMFVKEGILKLNSIRNRFSHDLDVEVNIYELDEMLEVLNITRKEIEYEDPVRVIQDFTTVGCTFLIVNEELDELFVEAFKHLH